MTTTKSGTYATFKNQAGKWFFHPTDSEWFSANRNDSFSRDYNTEAEALAQAELWEAQDSTEVAE